MSVLVECYSVVVRRFEIERRYPGRLAGYTRDCPNDTVCADTYLVRVGFMSERDVGLFLLRNLARAGLASTPTGKAEDLEMAGRSVAIVEQRRGPWHPDEAGWLEYAERPDGVCLAWLKGTPPGELSVPRGWVPGDAGSLVKLPPSLEGEPLPPGGLAALPPVPPGHVRLFSASAYGENASEDGDR